MTTVPASYGPAWLFDDTPIADPLGEGERAMRFIEDTLRHPKSTAVDRAVTLDPWQERLIRKAIGGAYRVIFVQVGRGNRKTSLGAIMALIFTFGPKRTPFGQVLSAAADRKQARIAYEESLSIVATSPRLKAAAQPQDFRNRLRHPKSGAVYEAISADAATQFGRTPMFALVDELWAWPKIELWHAIRTGLAKVPDSTLLITTTAGRGTTSPDYPIYQYAKRVAAGEVDDPSFLPVIFEAPADADWADEAVWHAANPGLALGYPDLAGLRQLAHEARERPADRAAFMQFHLGIRQEHSVAPFVEMSVYDEGAGEVDLELLRGEPCWLAVDCSATTDLTAILAAWRDRDDGFAVAAWFFVPEDALQARADRDGVPYPRWAGEGLITPTPGAAIDYRMVEAKIRDLVATFDVREIAFDRAYGAAVMGPLVDDGLPVVTMPQGWITQSPALNLLERAIISRKFRHGGHPVLRWCFENVVVHTDSAGNRVMHKGKSRDRIDGAVAAWMAVARAAASEGPTSIFDRPELWGDAHTGEIPQNEKPPIGGVSADGFDWSILRDPRHPRFSEERDRYNAALAARDDEFEDAW